MKPNIKNTTSDRDLTFDPSIAIVATFKGGKVFRGLLGELRDWAVANEADAPLSCITSEGRHGLFPCIIAENDRVASVLSRMTGARITRDDGATFATRGQMKQVARSLFAAGIRVSALACQWGVTKLPYAANTSAARKPAMIQGQLSIAEQHAEAPF